MGISKKRETRDELLNWIEDEFSIYDYLVCLDILKCNSSDNLLKNKSDKKLCHRAWVDSHDPDFSPEFAEFEYLREELTVDGLRQFKAAFNAFQNDVANDPDIDSAFRYNFRRNDENYGFYINDIVKLNNPSYVLVYYSSDERSVGAGILPVDEPLLVSYPDAKNVIFLDYHNGESVFFGTKGCEYFRVDEKQRKFDVLHLDSQLVSAYLDKCPDIISLLKSYDDFNTFKGVEFGWDPKTQKGTRIDVIERFTEKDIVSVLTEVKKVSEGESFAREALKKVDKKLALDIVLCGLNRGMIKYDTLLDLDRNLVRKNVSGKDVRLHKSRMIFF